MVTGIHAWRFFAMPADCGKGSVFPQRAYSVVLRMIKIITSNLAVFAFTTNIQIYKQSLHLFPKCQLLTTTC
jgi:hypothetical protein